MSAGTPGPPSATGTPPTSSRFTGKIEWVEIDIDAAAADEDHLISPEERLHLAMARQ